MKTAICFAMLAAATLASTGCKMCCPSYDYCMPTRPQESNSDCCGMERQGSAFNGSRYQPAEYFEDGVVVEEGVPMARATRGTPTPAPSIPRVSKSGAGSQR